MFYFFCNGGLGFWGFFYCGFYRIGFVNIRIFFFWINFVLVFDIVFFLSFNFLCLDRWWCFVWFWLSVLFLLYVIWRFLVLGFWGFLYGFVFGVICSLYKEGVNVEVIRVSLAFIFIFRGLFRGIELLGRERSLKGLSFSL